MILKAHYTVVVLLCLIYTPVCKPEITTLTDEPTPPTTSEVSATETSTEQSTTETTEKLTTETSTEETTTLTEGPSIAEDNSNSDESDENEAERECPKLNGKYVDFVPHESDCTKFYKCDWGELKLYNCSAGLHFNPVLNVCDRPEQAGCKAPSTEASSSSPNTTVTEPAPSQTPPSSSSTTESSSTQGSSSPGPTTVTESAPSQTPPSPPSTTESDGNGANGKCPKVNGEYVVFVPHEFDCTKFYKCDWGSLIAFNCPGGLHFNPVLDVCDWPQNAGCETSSSVPP